MTKANGDLDRTNNRRRKRHHRPLRCHLPRWEPQPRTMPRDKARRLELLTMLIGGGTLR